MAKVKAKGQMRNGQLWMSDAMRKEMMARCRAQFKEGVWLDITVAPTGKRTVPQNDYYWGCLIPKVTERLIELGNEVDEDTVHEFLKERFNPEPLIGVGGEIIGTKGGSTTDIPKYAFVNEYCERIVRWAAEFLEITIPPPASQNLIPFPDEDE